MTEAGTVVAFDGRLDNEDDLRLRFGSNLPPAPHDAQLVAAAFEERGLDGLRLLVGDWTVCIWSPRDRVLLLACDYLGIRPLYYRATARHVAWSTSLAELVTRERVGATLDDRYIVARLSGIGFGRATPYPEISPVEAGQAVVFHDDGSIAQQRVWRHEENMVRYARADDYEQHFRELFGQAVRARLRTDRPVLADLSGGLDSSAVVCMADHWVKRRLAAAPVLDTFSTTGETSQDKREDEFVRVVEAQIGRTGIRHSFSTVADEEIDEDCWADPGYTHLGQRTALRHLLNSGGRVWLTGQFGDAVTWNGRQEFTAVLESNPQRSVLSRAAELRLWCLAAKVPMIQAVSELLPNVVLSASALARRFVDTRVHDRAWSRTVVRNQVCLEQVCSEATDCLRGYLDCRDRSKRELMFVLGLMAMTRRLTVRPSMRGIYWTHPFADRRLVEYVLSIPTSSLVRPGEPRALMRRAMAGLWPESIGARQSKGPGSSHATRRLRSRADELCEGAPRMHVVTKGFVALDGLKSAIAAAIRGDTRALMQVARIEEIERWLNERERVFVQHAPTPEASRVAGG